MIRESSEPLLQKAPSKDDDFDSVGSKKARTKSRAVESPNDASEESIRKIREEMERMANLFELLAIKNGHMKTSETAEGLPPPPIAPPSTSPPQEGISP